MQIKPYEPMWYLFTYGDEPTIYPMPLSEAQKIMEVINQLTPPKYIDLTKYGYGRESASMIRGCRAYEHDEWDVQWYILNLTYEQKQKAKKFLKERNEKNLITTARTIQEYLTNI
jgi:hypothetical protein